MIEIIVTGNDTVVRAAISRLEAKLLPQSLGAFLNGTIDPILRNRIRNRFANEGDDVVGKWIPLTDTTKMIRISQQFPPGPINHRTGQLEAFISGSPSRIAMTAAGATLVMPGKAPRGKLKDKFETAQSGKAYPSTPPRPVLGLGQQDLAFTMTALEMYIREGM